MCRPGTSAVAVGTAGFEAETASRGARPGTGQGGGSVPEWKKDWGPADYAWNGVERAGLLGSGQFAVDAGEHGPLGGLAGPTIGQPWDAAKMLGGTEKPEAFALKAMPANALYSGYVKGAGEADPKFAD